MNWNTILKLTNKELRESELKERDIKIKKFEEYRETFNKQVQEFNKSDSKFYQIKDRFGAIYKYSLTIFTIWLLPIIALFFLYLSKGIVFLVILGVYIILTIAIGIMSLAVPVVKFLAFDMPNKIEDIKILISNKYVLAIFFTKYRTIIPIVKKIDNDGSFNYGRGDNKGTYFVDKSASFISSGKIMVLFYMENIPNPLKFDFKKYLDKFIRLKSENPKANVKDFEEETIDVSFSSQNIREFKKYKMFQEFFRDYQNDINKAIVAVLMFAGMVVVLIFIMYLFKGGN